jgi:hypothetical protein
MDTSVFCFEQQGYNNHGPATGKKELGLVILGSADVATTAGGFQKMA